MKSLNRCWWVDLLLVRIMMQGSVYSSSSWVAKSSSKTTLVHDVPDVIHGPHSLSSFCLGTPHFHRHRLL